ncbi:MAG TPA: ABC transporter ATP-binding protein [Clostridia bacterium]
MLKLFRMLRPYRWLIAGIFILLTAQSLGNLYLPELNANIINQGISLGDTAYILREGGIMLLVSLGLAGVSILATYLSSYSSMSFGRDMRSRIFRHVESFSQAEVDRFGAPSLITRCTNDAQQVQMLVHIGLTMMLAAPIMMIGGVIMATRQDRQLSILIAVIIPVMLVIIVLLLRRALPLFKSMQKRIDRVNLVMREKLSGVRVIRAFVRTGYETRRFDAANVDLADVGVKIGHLFAIVMPVMMLLFNLSTVAILWFGAKRVEAGMPIGNLTAFLTYVVQILMAVVMAVMMLVMAPRAIASGERIMAVLDTQPTIHDPASPRATLESRRGVLSFRDVGFRYPGAEDPVLCGISFETRPGETTAIVGSTGCGKSTLIQLIPRFYDATEGVIEMGGVDIRELALDDLRGRIGFVPQRAFLFRGSIADNLRDGRPDATDEEVLHALEVAQAIDFVKEMPDGPDTLIEQGGSNVSGGQRQRLAIARAVVRRPDVYIFDDPFSALDFTTEAALRAALHKETRDAAVIVVAQRISTVIHADRIVVLDEGSIAGIGTHRQLLETCDVYREIVLSQWSQEESEMPDGDVGSKTGEASV